MKIPVIALIDTNSDPEDVTIPIPETMMHLDQ